MAKDLAEKKEQLPANPLLDRLLNKATEGADADSFAIPFIKILQSNSPQCNPSRGEYNPEARPGMIVNTVTGELTDEIEILQCAFKREFLEWRPDRKGLTGRHSPSYVLTNDALEDDERGRPTDPTTGNTFQDTRQHYVLVHINDGRWQQALLPMASTQIKKSRNLMNVIAGAAEEGRLISVKLTTVPESNDQGDWFGWKLGDVTDRTTDADLVTAATGFINALEAGKVDVDESQFGESEAGGSSAPNAF